VVALNITGPLEKGSEDDRTLIRLGATKKRRNSIATGKQNQEKKGGKKKKGCGVAGCQNVKLQSGQGERPNRSVTGANEAQLASRPWTCWERGTSQPPTTGFLARAKVSQGPRPEAVLALQGGRTRRKRGRKWLDLGKKKKIPKCGGKGT